MENQSGVVVETELTQADGFAERQAAQQMIARRSPGTRRITVGADKAYDTADFAADLRRLNVTPHVAQNNKGRRSAIDRRTTCRPGYAVSQQNRSGPKNRSAGAR